MTTTVATGRGRKTLQQLGRLSGRETAMVYAVLALAILFIAGNSWVLGSIDQLEKERVRLAASQASLDNLSALLDRQEEIMSRANLLLSDYRQSKGVEPSSLLLQRIDRLRGRDAEMKSMHPLISGPGNRPRYRVELNGSGEDLGRLFHSLGEGAPPIFLKDVALSVSRARREALRAVATLEVHEEAGLDETVRLLERRLAEERGVDSLSVDDEDDESRRSRRSRRSRSDADESFPYTSLDRSDLFKWTRQVARGVRTITIHDLTSKLVFSGVVGGDDPKAIVEDRETGQIHYLHAGEFLGELEVREINATSVIVGYRDEEATLE